MENYQLMLDRTLAELEARGRNPRLLLHACCAPCSSYVLEYLSRYFEITLYFYNPNISSHEEYEKRRDELIRLVREMRIDGDVHIQEGVYEPEKFELLARGREDLPERSERCRDCYRLRLTAAAEEARRGGYDYFTTTLSISPHKNADWLCEIGGELAETVGVPYLYSDFKKKGGYLRSCELSAKYSLYRQPFCGCEYSRRAYLAREAAKK